MIDEFLKHADGDERVGARVRDGRSNFGRGNELAIEGELKGREGAEDDVLVLDRYCALVPIPKEIACARGQTHGTW